MKVVTEALHTIQLTPDEACVVAILLKEISRDSSIVNKLEGLIAGFDGLSNRMYYVANRSEIPAIEIKRKTQ